MKRCPECRREYDTSMMFCLDDGAELLYGPASDETPTAIFPESGVPPENAHTDDPDRTRIFSTETDEDASVGNKVPKTNHRRLFLITLVLAAVSVGGFFGYRYISSSTSKQISSVAVMPFVNESGDPDVEYLSDGMTETLINTLSQMPNLSVKARSSVFRYKGKDADAAVIGRELGVQAILNGRVIQRGESLTVYLELVDTAAGNRIWGEQYNRGRSDLVPLQREIARDVSQKLQLQLSSGDEKKLAKAYTSSSEALQLYLKGRYYWLKFPAKEYEKSRDYYEQAISADPKFALAFAGLGEYYGFGAASGFLSPDENWPKAKAAAEKAMELDDTIGAANNALAGVLQFDGDRRRAEEVLKRAITIDPSYLESRFHYSQFLAEDGRYEESRVQMEKVLEAEPLSARNSRALAMRFIYMRDFEQAVAQCQKTLELEPTEPFTYELLGNAFEQQGKKAEAIRSWSRSLTLRGDVEMAAILDRTFPTSGFDAAVRALWLRRLERISERTSRGEFVPAMDYALAYTRLLDTERAFTWLERAVNERNALKFEIKLDPVYEKLLSGPRFNSLLMKLHEVPEAK